MLLSLRLVALSEYGDETTGNSDKVDAFRDWSLGEL